MMWCAVGDWAQGIGLQHTIALLFYIAVIMGLAEPDVTHFSPISH